MIIFVNFRRAFITALLILGALSLFLGYNSAAGIFLSESQPVKGSAPVSSPANTEKKADPAKATLLNKTTVDRTGTAGENFFVDYRLQRERARSRQIDMLNDIVNNPSSAESTRKAAQDQLLSISKTVTREANVENLLKAWGYKDAVACIDQKGATVVVDSPHLSPSEESKIEEMISKETGFGEQGIVIIPKN